MISITISHGDWGYLTNLVDYSGGKVFENPPEGHTLSPGLDGTIIPGVPDKTLTGNLPGGYGFVRPFDAGYDRPSEKALEHSWATDRVPRLDYYVAIRNGCPQPNAFVPIYSDKVFVTSEDEDGEDLPRFELLRHLGAIGIKSNWMYWEPCQLFHGMGHGAVPLFHSAVRANTDYGPSWYEISCKLLGTLPAGYEWDTMGSHNYGVLYCEL